MNNKGILHKLMLVVILIAGFGLALTLPAWKRHQDQRHAQQTFLLLQQLAEQEQNLYAKQGVYTADLTSLPAAASCQSVQEDGLHLLRCYTYNIYLEQAHLLRAQSIKYPQWFSLDIESNTPQCQFDASSLVGEHLCAVVHL